ncbi:hypothetical protein HYDPIDRAFT_32645 [Hydnomerulius pinastri MD-312]|uniref:Uncharacterized protein n=1 Tax=Hydnomerulius pinastri MD-312 TaxID=994086 RepID=A0A0C9VQR2_9AGAM|nr:hypothetical protein HYDPIDRAFT_32645 [Hydnomerulius pinastri MD-312]
MSSADLAEVSFHHGPQGPPLRSKLDEHMSRLDPGHHRPMTEKELKMLLCTMGATEHSLPQYLEKYDKWWENVFSQFPDGRPPVLGEKPHPDDPTIQHFNIPDSDLAIRIWSGGMERHRQYCLDFFDTCRRCAVDTPDGYEILFLSDVYMPGEKLVTWETAMDVAPEDLLPGAEKYSVTEGSELVLKRPGRDDFLFQIPVRPNPQGYVFAQPVPFHP